MDRTLCIVGAGPKSLAIASKAHVLKLLGWNVPKILIVEKSEVAANWLSGSGLTTGRLPLGTSPEKDVGFPYHSFQWGMDDNPKVNQMMLRFSWQSFLIENRMYSDWVDRGRPSPTHFRWAEYLKWVFEQVKETTTLKIGAVTKLQIENEMWQVEVEHEDITETLLADGIVITGPGKMHMPVKLPLDDRIVSFKRFWNNIHRYSSQKHSHIAIVGNGENAATVAVTLAQIGEIDKIDIISPSAMNFSRGESYVENHVYTDPFQGNWFQLTKENRREVIARTDRGVFSIHTKKILDEVESVEIIPGKLMQVEIDRLGQLLLHLEYAGSLDVRKYDHVIIATGFDSFRFLEKILPIKTQEQIKTATGIDTLSAENLEASIDSSLSVKGLKPNLHLPMLAGLEQGPGYPNLSCLGRLADSVLAHYATPNGST